MFITYPSCCIALSFEIMGLAGSFSLMNCTAVHQHSGGKPWVNGIVIALAKILNSSGSVARIFSG